MKTHSYLSEIEKICLCHHYTVDEIFERLKNTYPKVGRSTVYRNIEELVKDGKLKELKGTGTKSIYESTKEEHIHLICEKTGKIYDVNMCDIEIKGLPKDFNVKDIDLRVYGNFNTNKN